MKLGIVGLDSVKITMNGTTFDNDNFASAKIKINTISKYLIDSIEIRTVHGMEKDGKDYERKITVKIPKKTVEALDKSKIQAFLENASVDGAGGKWKTADDGSGSYSVSLKGSAEEINEFTAKFFGSGSSFTYVSDGTLNTAFSETGVLYDKVNFERFPCNSDGSCNATFNVLSGVILPSLPERPTGSISSISPASKRLIRPPSLRMQSDVSIAAKPTP